MVFSVFSGNRAKDFSETLAQVRVPEMQKSDEGRFLDKTPHLGVSGQKRPKSMFLAHFFGFSGRAPVFSVDLKFVLWVLSCSPRKNLG